MERLKIWLAGGASRRILLVLGGLLVLPTISRRLVLDDHLQAVVRMSKPPIDGIAHSWVDLFTFGKPGPINDLFIERGILLPWWTSRDYRVAFFRPLSALTHALDGLLWPQSPVMAHVQSIAWYVLLLALVSRMYTRLLEPAWLAGLALLLFVCDDTHGDAVNWIANRNAIVAAVFGLLAFETHLRHRSRAGRDGRGKRGAWVGPACFGVALMAGESATATCAYLFSYALFLDSASRRSRASSLLPYVIIVVVWRAIYQRLGYGAFGGDGYIDPAREPIAFMVRLPKALAVLLQGQLGGLPSDFWAWSPPGVGTKVLACAFVSSAVFFLLVYPLLRHDRMARFWCASMVGAFVPSTATAPTDRTLLFSGIAFAGLLAQIFATFFERHPAMPQRGPWRIAAAVPTTALLLRKLMFAPLLLVVRDRAMAWLGEVDDRATDAVPNESDLAQRSLIVVNPPSIDLASYIALIRATRGQSVPKTVRWFSTATSDLVLTRTSERSLLVRPARGFLSDWPDRIYRSSRHPMKLGEKVELSDVTVTVTELRPEGNPAAADFEFHEPLESPHHLWLRWDQHGCAPFSPPRVGETVTLPAIDGQKLLRDMFESG